MEDSDVFIQLSNHVHVVFRNGLSLWRRYNLLKRTACVICRCRNLICSTGITIFSKVVVVGFWVRLVQTVGLDYYVCLVD